MPAMLANREDIDANMDDQLPVLKPPDHPYCYASDFKVPGSHSEDMRSDPKKNLSTVTRSPSRRL